MRALFFAGPAYERLNLLHEGEVYDVMASPLLVKAAPAGTRWITVHPNGKGEKGVPVLIQETAHGSGTYHVVGGAGGKLNYLKLTGVKSKDEYAGEVRKKQAEVKAQKKEQIARDKASGIHESKQAQREANTLVQRNAERKFIETVAKVAGWDESATKFPEEKAAGLSEAARGRAESKFHTTLMHRALEVADLQQKSLAIAADERLEEINGETPETDAERSLGYATNYGERTKDQAADIAAEAGAVDTVRRTEDERKQVGDAKERATKIKNELAQADIAPAPIKAKILEIDKQLTILKAKKELKNVAKQVRAAQKAVDRGEQKAYVIEVGSAPTDDEIQKDVENDMRTLRTRAFLDEIGKIPGGEDSLGRHIGVGAYNALNGVALAVSGSSVVDRDAVDVLGISGAAHALAMRMRADMPPEEYAKAVEAMEQYHVDHYMARSEAALAEAAGLQELLHELKMPDAEDGNDLAMAHELNQRRREAIGDTNKMLGQALGEMEANAALLTAMKDKRDKAEPISMGKLKSEDAIRRLRAIGLQRGDYTIDHAGSSVIASISADGLKRIAQPLDYENAAATRESIAIMAGKRDEPDFWPMGIARRPDLALASPEPAVSAALSQPFTPGADLGSSMRDYIGGRMADGHAIGDIVKDLQSEDMIRMAADRRGDYMQALDQVVPLSHDGKPIEAESRRAGYEKLAEDFVQREYGGKFAPIHAQTFDADEKSADALHRAFAEHPAGPLAFKAVGDLDASEQGALRAHFDKNIAPPDKEGAALRQQLAEHEKSEPERETRDMFGDTVTSPEHAAWSKTRAELGKKIDETGLSWKKYQGFMGSTEAAYRAVQDHLRGQVVKEFHAVHNKLNPDKLLKLGRTVVSNHLRHIEAVDPAMREKRLAETRELIDNLRERSGGRYAAGSVSEKMDAARERQAAAEQSQLGMFAAAPAETPGQAERELAADERYTLGAAAEARLSQMAPKIGEQFKPGQPVKIWRPGMTGKFVGQQRAIKLIQHNKRLALAQGTGCVHGSTILDDAEDRGWSFHEWALSGEFPTVFAVDHEGLLRKATALPIFTKGISRMLKITHERGHVTVSENHVFLTRRGWVKANEVNQEDCLCASIPSKVSAALQGKLHPKELSLALKLGCEPDETAYVVVPNGVFSCGPTARGSQDFQANCLKDCHQDDEPFQSIPNTDQSFSPLLPGVQAHTLENPRLDVHASISEYARLRTRSDRLSNHDSSSPSVLRKNRVTESHVSSARGAQFVYRSAEFLQFQRPSDFELGKGSIEHADYELGDLVDIFSSLSSPAQFRARAGRAERSYGSPQNTSQHACMSPAFDKPLEAHQEERHDSLALAFSAILSIEYVGDYTVYDVHVPEFHNYLAAGVVHHNSGKTAMMLGSMADLMGKGKIKRALAAVPSIVQGQYNSEALNLLEPGKFKWHAEPGASREERLKAYADPGTHLNVVTHQSFRDDLLHLGAKQAGTTEQEMSAKLDAMSDEERRTWAKQTMAAHGMDHDYMMIDEGHNLLNRAGKENSGMANVLDAVSANIPYYVNATADPIKNDPSEIYDVLHKMDHKRYSDRDAFMRRYGIDTISSKDALRRELARYFFPGHIKPDVKVHAKEQQVELTDEQHQALRQVNEHVAAMRMARLGGEPNIEAAKALSPDSFEGQPESAHAEIATRLARSVGIMKQAAIANVIDAHPRGAKLEDISRMAKDRRGKPGLVFARNLKSVDQIAERLRSDGHRVVTITGKDSSKSKYAKKVQFSPDHGDASADIMVLSDAGAAGLNAQRGAWLVQNDTPMTAMLHNQRNGRINRLGQKNPDIELIDLVGNHDQERDSRARLKQKYGLRTMMTSPLERLDDTGFAAYLHRADAVQKEVA